MRTAYDTMSYHWTLAYEYSSTCTQNSEQFLVAVTLVQPGTKYRTVLRVFVVPSSDCSQCARVLYGRVNDVRIRVCCMQCMQYAVCSTGMHAQQHFRHPASVCLSTSRVQFLGHSVTASPTTRDHRPVILQLRKLENWATFIIKISIASHAVVVSQTSLSPAYQRSLPFPPSRTMPKNRRAQVGTLIVHERHTRV